MLRFFERHRLVKKGLACPKTRRRRSQSEILQMLETGPLAKSIVFLGFILGLAALIFYSAQPQPTEKFLLCLLIFLTALDQLWINHPHTFARNSRLLLMFGAFLVHLTLMKVLLVLGRDGAFAMDDKAMSLQIATLWLPYAFAPLVMSVLLGRNHGVFAATFVSLWGSIVFYNQVDPAKFLVMSLISGFIAVFVTLQVRRRSRLIRAGVFVGIATWLLALIFGLIGPILWEALPSMNWKMLGFQSLVAVGSGIITAMLIGGALPVLEGLFSITTEISWLEAADLNHPLLKRMTIEAPGTYHHSLVVANLAEAAAEAIGANATKCRVCSYFHDIGKLVKPDYFTENMGYDQSPHMDLAPTMSALIIIAHVKEGVDLALKYKLSQQIIDVIQQHHGTSLVLYFYRRALQLQEDARQGGKIMNIREGDIPEVREESFRYSGPKPQSKEAGIISLADAAESASRTLEKVTPQKLDQLINDIIERRIQDRQLDECDLTLRDLRSVAESFRFTLLNMLHSRIAYPSSQAAKGQPQPLADAPPVSAA